MDIIVAAKDRQAAEANRAAESLLEILAREVATFTILKKIILARLRGLMISKAVSVSDFIS